MPGLWEIIIIFIIVMLVFGAKRIPEIMGGIGKGIKSFKRNLNSDGDSLKSPDDASTPVRKDSAEPK
ncbi:MAG: twin-arginine translocase TatA/TatE family subunit [Desulfomonile tiedjei]|uniref:Sec-independent protein translocase protein TatA n=1 Tax=Desulfomonile tiedjei TaxID=2358 RepID=A0A9D6Z1U4_9BACT|nr:twin-arginine translocase TatA/TatE family subunit [Desulfomonile tiedjei]